MKDEDSCLSVWKGFHFLCVQFYFEIIFVVGEYFQFFNGSFGKLFVFWTIGQGQCKAIFFGSSNKFVGIIISLFLLSSYCLIMLRMNLFENSAFLNFLMMTFSRIAYEILWVLCKSAIMALRLEFWNLDEPIPCFHFDKLYLIIPFVIFDFDFLLTRGSLCSRNFLLVKFAKIYSKNFVIFNLAKLSAREF